MSKDYYQILEVSKSASAEEIQKSYRRLARKYHPDLNPDDKSAQQKFKDIQHAYDVLNDPEKRRMYDQLGPDFERVGAGGASPGGGTGPGFEEFFGSGGGAGPAGFGFGSIDEILQQFGGGGGGGGRGRPRGSRSAGARAQAQGEDLRVSLAVPFNTAVLGGTASISVTRGSKQESIQVRIPPGVVTGTKMRLRGQGHPGIGGGPNGDLIVELDVAPHPFFQRSGFNLELRLPISLQEAVLGATVDVPTPSGIVALRIPPGSSSGKKLRVKARGVHDSKGNVGDLYVELQIKLPHNLREPDQVPVALKDAVAAVEKMYDQPLRDDLRW